MKTLKELATAAASAIIQEGDFAKTNKFTYQHDWFNLYERLRNPSAVNALIRVVLLEEIFNITEDAGMSEQEAEQLRDDWFNDLKAWTPVID
jgi:hypothetical protein